jgi:hypothetical protein
MPTSLACWVKSNGVPFNAGLLGFSYKRKNTLCQKYPGCISCSSHCCDKIPDISNLEE